MGTSTRLQAPDGFSPYTGAFLKVELNAIDGDHASWARPVSAYFQRALGGWSLVGFERLPGL
jgi:hypothetical protein